MLLENIKTTDLDPDKKYTFVIPMGATEQHGPFLPIGTDSFLMDNIMKEAEPSFTEFVFLPTIRVTCSEEHQGFIGSVWVSFDTMKRVLYDMCASLQPYASTIAFASFHGGNLSLLDEFVKDQSFEDVALHHLEVGSEETENKMRELLGGPTDEHAGNVEISMMLVDSESLVTVPTNEHPKHLVEQPFKTNRLKDFCKDGIADNHPEWIVSKENGKVFIEWTVEDFKKELAKL